MRIINQLFPAITKPYQPIDHATRKWASRQVTSIKYLVIHQSASMATLENINRYHIGPNHISDKGCPSFCYHFFVDTDGTIYQCNNETDITWSNGKVRSNRRPSHAENLTWHKGMNTEAINICVRGDFAGEGYKGSNAPTKEQLVSIERLRLLIMQRYGIKPSNVIGHCHITPRACPGFTIMDFIEQSWSKLVNAVIS
jgi:N-acetyl-anhydromuramyl-L-alanine amidase AmpD